MGFLRAPVEAWIRGVRPLFVPLGEAQVEKVTKEKRKGEEASAWQVSVIEDGRASSDLRVGVRTISELKTPAKRLTDAIYFDGLDILRCYEGRFRFSFKDRPAIELKPGEALVIYPRHTVTIDALKGRNALVYGVFEGADVEHYFDTIGFYDCAKGRTDAHFESIMELKDLLESPHGKEDVHGRMCLSFLTDILMTQAMEMRANGNALVFDAVRQIHKNLHGRVASMKMLCNQLGVSRVHLHRTFVKAGLGAPSDFIRAKQMQFVRDLLTNTELPLAEVAARAGFLSPSHFTTFVKRMTRLTPTQVRQGKVA